MKIVLRKRVKSHVFEKIIIVFMIMAAISSVYIFIKALQYEVPPITLAVIEILLILILVLLIQTILLIRIFENTLPKK